MTIKTTSVRFEKSNDKTLKMRLLSKLIFAMTINNFRRQLTMCMISICSFRSFNFVISLTRILICSMIISWDLKLFRTCEDKIDWLSFSWVTKFSNFAKSSYASSSRSWDCNIDECVLEADELGTCRQNSTWTVRD